MEEYTYGAGNAGHISVKLGKYFNLVHDKHISAYGEESADNIVENIVETYKNIQEQLSSPKVSNNVLMVGKVQSGKTSNLELFTAVAFDNGYNILVIYGGYDTSLLKQTTERYREKETVTDQETGEEVVQFKVETGVTYEDLEIETIDPLDFYVDAVDYCHNPKSCPKVIRTWISARELLTDKTNYPLLTEEDKKAIIQKNTTRDLGYPYVYSSASTGDNLSYSKTAEKQIEVLTFMGDYVTLDGKLLTNIKAIVVEGQLGLIEYNGVDSLQIIYAPYTIDRETHRGVSPLCSSIPLNRLKRKLSQKIKFQFIVLLISAL